MKTSIIILSAILILGCKGKEIVVVYPPQPNMQYTSLNNRETKFDQPQHLDIDSNGNRDLSITVMHIADPVLNTETIRFYVNSGVGCFVAADALDFTAALDKGAAIPGNSAGFTWSEVIAPSLVEKVTDLSWYSNWRGRWQNAYNKYLPFYLQKNDNKYYGWIEMSMDIMSEKMTLHRLAISKEPGKPVNAGL